jgi:cystathionine beta-lyase family protein involved in aluminum resistance
VIFTGDDFRISGELHVLVRERGLLVAEFFEKNLVTTVGKQLVAENLLVSPTWGKPSHIAVGTGTTPAVVGDTVMETAYSTRAVCNKERVGAQLYVSASFYEGFFTSQQITEWGLFDASTLGHMIAHIVRVAVACGPTTNLSAVWKLTFS